MPTIEMQAAIDIRAPIAGEIVADAITAASVRYVVPSSWVGKFVTVKVAGMGASDVCYVLFGGSGVTASATQNSTTSGSPKSITPHATTAWPLVNGEERVFRVRDAETHFAVIGSAAAGRFFAYMSQNT